MKRFALGIGAGIAAVFGGLATAYATLSVVWPERLPAPAISRLVPLDEKLRFLRRHPTLDPSVLAVGSSITWRQLDGDAFERGGGFLNGATGYLKIHQTHDLLDFYLEHFARVGTVLILTGPPDFEDCTDQPAQMLRHEDASAYAFDRWPAPYFYVRYFSPQRYLRSIMTLSGRRTPFTGDLFLDDYGSSPLDVPASMKRGLRYDAVSLDPACTDALTRLVHEIDERNLRLVVVFAPIHPEYRARHPEVVEWTAQVAREVAANAVGLDARVIRLYADPDYAPADFFDAFHLQWPAVRRLSADIVDALSQPPEATPPLATVAKNNVASDPGTAGTGASPSAVGR